MDAAEKETNPLLEQGAQALRKALKTDDLDLRLGYIERAEGFLGAFAQTLAQEVTA